MNKNTIEKDILGEVLVNFNLSDKFLTQLKQQDFSDTRHKYLYVLIEKLVQANKEFDVTDAWSTYPNVVELCGGVDYIGELMGDYTTSSNFDSKVKSLIKLSTIDSLHALARSSESLMTEDFNKGLSLYMTGVENLFDRVNKEEVKVDIYQSFLSSLYDSKNNVDLGFKSLHSVLGYPHPGELLILGARPAVGKTAFALNCLFNYACLEKKRTIMFSLEMTQGELFSRMVSTISGIPISNMRDNNITEAEGKCLEDNAKELSSNSFLSIYDRKTTIASIRSAIRKESKIGEVGLVVIDYLQLINSAGNSPYEKVSEVSRQLKLIAQEFNCTVVALSQLSRKVEERSDKRPQLADLRESGAIEQDADYVLFLYRHNLYANDPSVKPEEEVVNVIIAKNRHGKTGTVQLNMNLPIGKFSDMMEE